MSEGVVKGWTEQDQHEAVLLLLEDAETLCDDLVLFDEKTKATVVEYIIERAGVDR